MVSQEAFVTLYNISSRPNQAMVVYGRLQNSIDMDLFALFSLLTILLEC